MADETAPTTPTNAAELQALVTEIQSNEPAELAPSARGYTIAGGFRAYSPLTELPVATLLSMGACVNSALAEQAAAETEGAGDALNLLVSHAGDAVVTQRNEAQFMKFLGMAVNLGYGEDAGIETGSDLYAIEMPERAVCEGIVDAFLESQPKVAQNTWSEWVTANA